MVTSLTNCIIFPTFILPTCLPSGAHTQLNLSSKPTLAELDELIVRAITDGWEQVVLHLGVESFVIDTLKRDNPGPSEEVCREVLNRWLSAEPGTGEAERTWGSVLEALETNRHRQLAEQLRREQIGESPVFCIGWFITPHSLKSSAVWCPLTVILLHTNSSPLPPPPPPPPTVLYKQGHSLLVNLQVMSEQCSLRICSQWVSQDLP